MFTSLRLRLRLLGRRILLQGLGSALGLVGAAFLTAALFLALAAWQGALFACVILGLLFCGAGVLLIAIGVRRPLHAPHPLVPPAVPVASSIAALAGPLATAFVLGVQNGIAARSRGSRRD